MWRLLIVSLWCIRRFGRWLPAYQVAPFARLSTTLFQVRFSIHAKKGTHTRFFDEKVFSRTLVVRQTGSLPLKAEHIGAVNCTYLAIPTIGSYLWKWRFFGIFFSNNKKSPKTRKTSFSFVSHHIPIKFRSNGSQTNTAVLLVGLLKN